LEQSDSPAGVTGNVFQTVARRLERSERQRFTVGTALRSTNCRASMRVYYFCHWYFTR